MLPFLESPRFNVEIRYGTTGGPSYLTDVSTNMVGVEYRNSNWLDSKGKWDIGSDVYNKLEIEALVSFFRERKGRLGAFRFKDWTDFRVGKTEGKLEAVGGSSPSMRMVRVYSWGGETTSRIIAKPVPGTVKFYAPDGNEVPEIAIDFTTGVVDTNDDSLTWEGEFDIPVRFDSDTFNVEFAGYRKSDGETLYTVSGLTIREIPA